MGRHLTALLLTLGCSGAAMAWNSPAPDVVLYCTPALEAPLRAVARRFTDASRVPVHIFIAPSNGLIGLLRHRARDDVIVADATTIRTLADAHLVHTATVVALGANPYVLATSADAALPPGGAAALLATHTVVLTDPTTAADFDGAAVLHAALPSGNFKSIGVADTRTVAALIGADSTLVGVLQRTEASGGLHEAAPLAVPANQVAGALVVQGQSANAAALLAYACGQQGRSILRQAGLETGS